MSLATFLRSARNALLWPWACHAALQTFLGLAGARATWRHGLDLFWSLPLKGMLLRDSCIGRASARARRRADSVGD